jgi:hypothetical protein
LPASLVPPPPDELEPLPEPASAGNDAPELLLDVDPDKPPLDPVGTPLLLPDPDPVPPELLELLDVVPPELPPGVAASESLAGAVDVHPVAAAKDAATANNFSRVIVSLLTYFSVSQLV